MTTDALQQFRNDQGRFPGAVARLRQLRSEEIAHDDHDDIKRRVRRRSKATQ